MTELLEFQALLTLIFEGSPCFVDPCVIYYTCKEHKKHDKKWEKQDKPMTYTNDQGK